jgi:hypothetical protein
VPIENGAFGGDVPVIVKLTVKPGGDERGRPTAVPTGEYAGTLYEPDVVTVGRQTSAGALHTPEGKHVTARPDAETGAEMPAVQPMLQTSPGTEAEQELPGPSQPRVITTLRKRAWVVGGIKVVAVSETMVGFGVWNKPAVPV